MKKNTLNFNLFKLIVTILLILILAILLIQKPMAVVSSEKTDMADIKEPEGINADQCLWFPLSDGSLELDEERSGLLDINGVIRFELSDDEQTWEPVIPGEILSKLPDDITKIRVFRI